MHLRRLIYSKFGRYIISFLLGIGLASLFKRACNERNCLKFVAAPIDKIDKQLTTSTPDNATKLTQNKNYMIGLKKDLIRIYNQTFKVTSDWKLSKQKKTKPSTRSSSIKQASNESGLAQHSS